MSNKDALFKGRDSFHFNDIRDNRREGRLPDGTRASPQQQRRPRRCGTARTC
jgi:hypothetical protein